jgi:hypothetical protein
VTVCLRKALWLLVALLAGAAVSGCSSPVEGGLAMSQVEEKDRLQVAMAMNRQIQIGFQIQAVATADNALDSCFEMCNRSSESCRKSQEVCNVSKRYPKVPALSANCNVTRERCRNHRTQVPRQCPCE